MTLLLELIIRPAGHKLWPAWFLGWTPLIQTIQKKLIIQYLIKSFTPRQVYCVVKDVSKYREFIPWCTESKISKFEPAIRPEFPNAQVANALLAISFMSLVKAEYKSRVLVHEFDFIQSQAESSSFIEYLRFDWHFFPTKSLTGSQKK